MTEPEEPSRLDDDASVPAGLRDVLRSARSDLGSDAQVARLAARLAPLLALPPEAAAPAPAQAAAGLSGGAKLGLGAVALLLAGGGAWLLSTSEATAPAAAPPHAVPVVPPPAAPASVLEVIEPPVEAAPSASEPSARLAPSKPAPALSEAELLEQARSALKGNPARALTRANEHRARFPRGVLIQEREVIAIQALRQLGRSAEADKRADAFAKAFPGSAFQRKLQPKP